MRGKTRKTAGFTLIELLVVIGIIAVLAAIIFPVFAQVRGKARQATCQSNLRQVGMAILMYTQDYDGQFPWAVDASDRYVPVMWKAACRGAIAQMPMLHDDPKVPNQPGALSPYVKSKEVWRCPSDTGFTKLDNNFDPSTGDLRPMAALPTMYQAFGGSYLYRTEVSFRQKNIDSLSGYRMNQNGQREEIGQAGINLLFDGGGSWHGGGLFPEKRYVVLFADAHSKLLSYDKYQEAWAVELDSTPTPYPCED